MFDTTESKSMDGIYLHDLPRGAVIDADTKSHHYRIEYLGHDEIRISGHPGYCPTLVAAQLRGSLGPTGSFQAGFVARGMRLVFRRDNDNLAVVTSPVTELRQENG